MAINIHNRLLNPENVSQHITLGLDTKSGSLVTKVLVSKKIFKNVSTRVAVGAAIGGVAAAAAGATITAAGGGKVGVKIILKSSAIGGVVGGFVGGVSGALKAKSEIKRLKEVDRITQAVSKKEMDEMCQALFERLFQSSEDITCGISLEVMAIPVKVTHCKCTKNKPRFEWERIYEWVSKNRSCPICRDRIGVKDLKFCEATFYKISQVVKQALDHLAKIAKIDLYDKKLINDVLNDRTRLKIDANTADRIREGVITPIEAYAISRHLKKSLERYNDVINSIFTEVMQKLSDLQAEDAITRQSFGDEVTKLTVWRNGYMVQ